MSSFRLLRMVGRANPIATVRHHRIITNQIQTLRYISSSRPQNSANSTDNNSFASAKGPQNVQTTDVKTRISELINKSDKNIFVFMKGTPKEPACSYSAMVVQILDAYGLEFNSCNVMENPDIRQGVKEYSNWPTIPQVFKNGSFIGGCDILLQMHQNGELKKIANIPE